MNTIKRLTVKTMPKGKVNAHHIENAMTHRYVAAEGKTLCGRTVGADDKRWVADARGAEADINCKRCLKRMAEDALGSGKKAAKADKKGTAKKGTRKRSAKANGEGKMSKAAERIKGENFNPVPKPTRTRKAKAVAGADTFGEALL